jgi:hypothetical protein
MLDANGIHPHDVQACVSQQYGSKLSIRHNRATDEIEFVATDASTLSPHPECIATLALRGRGQTVTVALMAPYDPFYFTHAAAPQTKVVPTRSKKLLLI